MKITKTYLLIALFGICTSCTQTKTTHTIETNRSTSSDGTTSSQVHKVEDFDDDKSCKGIASCTVDFVGDVIAFPFRLVAGLVEVIF